MTEMGWGGGVECRARQVHHLREADLYCEIVDPQSGRPLPEGESGEVVFTTLNRRGMPLIRYRSGDVAPFLPGACPCGTVLKRLGPVCRCLDSVVRICPGCELTMARLDEALFSIPRVIDFSAELTTGKAKIRPKIMFRLTPETDPTNVMRSAEAHLTALPEIATAIHRAGLSLGLLTAPAAGRAIGRGAKRTIKDRRKNVSMVRQSI
jgi:phenylacetate-coenzyme A ligase PaaK-like adenylate-forming protein